MSPSPEKLMQYLLMLRNNGVTDQRVLHAMELIPRDPFATGSFQDRAYEDTALPIASGQTLSQPSVVGKMTQALNPGPRDKVLEIGTGSGFQAAVLSQLARRVYTVERFAKLAQSANKTLNSLGLVNVTVITADGSMGLPNQAPFDRIILTAAAEDPPARGRAAALSLSNLTQRAQPSNIHLIVIQLTAKTFTHSAVPRVVSLQLQSF